MKKLLLITILFISLSCSTDSVVDENCSTITNIGFRSNEGYYLNLDNGNTIYTGYILPNYQVGDKYCI